jgi:hypothetical protein
VKLSQTDNIRQGRKMCIYVCYIGVYHQIRSYVPKSSNLFYPFKNTHQMKPASFTLSIFECDTVGEIYCALWDTRLSRKCSWSFKFSGKNRGFYAEYVGTTPFRNACKYLQFDRRNIPEELNLHQPHYSLERPKLLFVTSPKCSTIFTTEMYKQNKICFLIKLLAQRGIRN